MASLDETKGDTATPIVALVDSRHCHALKLFFKLSPTIPIGKREFKMPVNLGSACFHSKFMENFFENEEKMTSPILPFDIDPHDRGFHLIWYAINGLQDYHKTLLSRREIITAWNSIEYLGLSLSDRIVAVFCDLILEPSLAVITARNADDPELYEALRNVPKPFRRYLDRSTHECQHVYTCEALAGIKCSKRCRGVYCTVHSRIPNPTGKGYVSIEAKMNRNFKQYEIVYNDLFYVIDRETKKVYAKRVGNTLFPLTKEDMNILLNTLRCRVAPDSVLLSEERVLVPVE
jgi:hypothetical protein